MKHLTFRIETPKHMIPVEELHNLDETLNVIILNGGREVGRMKMGKVKLKYLKTGKDTIIKGKVAPARPGTRPGGV